MYSENSSVSAVSPYLGNMYQLFGTRHYQLTDGISNGCRCIDVRTGSGLEYTVLCDRGLDISLATYKGFNLTFLTQNAEAHPAFYHSCDAEWMRTFTGGLLTTCGPNYLSSPCEDEGEKLGLHGRWSSLPAKHICDFTDTEKGEIKISGMLYEAVTMGHKLSIYRSISSKIGESVIMIDDEIKNEGSRAVPLNVLYHINFGYPFLDENTHIEIPSKTVIGYDEYTNERMNEAKTIRKPYKGAEEKNYLHTFDGEMVTAKVHNPEFCGGLSVYIRFNSENLPYMTQWVLEDYKDYVLAIEPANVPCESRNILRENGIFPMLEPGEIKKIHVEIEVVSNK
ncbi:MAG: DUF4432 family protein [Clostridia bacterium]|nr:DUF4432 family protein [Clostridia bacterium]